MSDVWMEFDISGKIASELRPKAHVVVKHTADMVRRQYQQSQSGPRSGRIYKVSKSGQPHQASAPGEPPARDTGNLAGSSRVTMLGDLTGVVEISAEYGLTLEFGGAHVAPRPALEPAVEMFRPEFEAALKTLLPS